MTVQRRSNPWEKGVLLNFSSKLWFATVKIPKDKLKNLPSSVRGIQDLLTDRGPLDEVHSVYKKAKAFIRSETLDFPINAFTFVDKDRVEFIDGRLQEFDALFNEKVEALDKVYRKLIRQTKADLEEEGKARKFKAQDFFDESRYPKRVKDRFRLSWNYYDIEVSGVIGETDPRLLKQKQKEYQGQWDEFLDMTFIVAREAVLKKVEVIRDSAVNETIDQRSVTAIENVIQKWEDLWSGHIGEREFRMAMAQVKKEVKGMSADRLRDNEAYRKEVIKTFTGLAKDLSAAEPKKRAIKVKKIAR